MLTGKKVIKHPSSLSTGEKRILNIYEAWIEEEIWIRKKMDPLVLTSKLQLSKLLISLYYPCMHAYMQLQLTKRHSKLIEAKKDYYPKDHKISRWKCLSSFTTWSGKNLYTSSSAPYIPITMCPVENRSTGWCFQLKLFFLHQNIF